MVPKFVSPCRMSGKRGKNDAADAVAIREAVTRPAMRFVPLKEAPRQIILALHRTRQGFVEERTATDNRLRNLISEFGIVLPQKVTNLRRDIALPLEEPARRCPPVRWRPAGPRRWACCPRTTAGSSPRLRGRMRSANG